VHEEFPGWSSANALAAAARAFAAPEQSDLERVLASWDDALHALGRDPSRRDWLSFRPLRLGREEDWSDWLAHLLQTSSTGVFAHALLGTRGEDAEKYASPEVVRERVVVRLQDVGGERRADLVIGWKNGAASQIEVKVGDEELEKTFETVRLIRKTRPPTVVWRDFILLQESALPMWAEVAERCARDYPEIKIEPLTWRQVAVALRRSLLAERARDLVWCVWAYSFCGAIEQRILGLPRVGSHGQRSLAYVTSVVHQIALLKEALQ